MSIARKDKNIIAMIPARIGSERLKMKNLALLNGKPLISYAINAAKSSGIFDKVVINSEDEIFAAVSKRYGVGFYKRPQQLGSSSTKSDYVVNDFIANNPCNILVWVNPTSPLQQGEEIRRVVDYFLKEKIDTMITVKDEQVHCTYKGRPINFKICEPFAKTQDLIPVNPFVYSLMIWRTDLFMKYFLKNGHAFFCGKVGYYPVSKESSVIIKRREDLVFAEYILRAAKRNSAYKLRYDKLAGLVK